MTDASGQVIPPLERRIGGIFVMLAAAIMASGVAAAAAAAHINAGREQAAAALILLSHAPMLAGVGVGIAVGLVPVRTGTFGAGLALLGAILFAVDMMARADGHGPLFALAAPTGGSAAIFGWTFVFIGLVINLGRRPAR